MDPPDLDAERMLAFIEGDEGAFNELVELYRQPLVNFLYRQTWNRDQAEDLAQDVFVKLYRHRDQYRPQGPFKTYLFRIATNLWIDTCRSEGRRPRPLSLDRPSGADEGRSLASQVVDGERTPQTALDKRELMEAIQRAIEALPEEQRLVFHLSEGQGLKYAEIATALDIPVGTVKSRMFHAVRKLQDSLRRFRGGSGDGDPA